MRDSINRRDFLKLTGTAAAGVGLANCLGSTASVAAPAVRKLSANDKLTVAVIGTNGRGMAHIECLTGLPGIEIAYICDVDDRAVANGIKAAAKLQKTEPKGAKDFRTVL